MQKGKPPVPFRVEVRHPEDDTTVIVVSGEVDMCTIQKHLNRHVETIGSAKDKVVIDLRPTTYIDSEGWKWIERMYRAIVIAGKELVIKVLSVGAVKRFFDIMGPINVKSLGIEYY